MSAKPKDPTEGTGASTPSPDEPKTKLELVTPETRHPLEIPRSRLKMLGYATAQEKGEEGQDVGFSARLFAQVSLPQRNPGEIQYYERRNGDVTLTISPGLVTQKDGSRVRKYPYGLYPRLALTYIATEAFKTQSPVVDLGKSMRTFLSRIGVDYSGRNANIVKNQLAALFSAQLSVEGLAINEDGHGTVSEYFQIAKSVSLWWANKENRGEEGLWSSEVMLSHEFFESIRSAPVPVDLKAIRALGGSSFRMDMYVWMTYRMYYLQRTTRIKWEDLNNQFGAQYGRLRAFRAAFIKELQALEIVYPQMNVEVTPDFLILHPSLTHVPTSKPRRQVTPKSGQAS